jgi:hypothetical protein
MAVKACTYSGASAVRNTCPPAIPAALAAIIIMLERRLLVELPGEGEGERKTTYAIATLRSWGCLQLMDNQPTLRILDVVLATVLTCGV